MSAIFVVAGKRTPFGSFGGSLKALTPTQLGVVAAKAAFAQGGVDPSIVDASIWGNINPSAPDAAYTARHIGLKSGCPSSSTALTLNRACGSGFESVIQGANAIKVGDAKVALCGGTENMSMAPLQVCGNDARWGVGLGKGLTVRDGLWAGLSDDYVQLSMGMTAENLADKYNITRQQCDEFALRSQRNWKAAHDNGLFGVEMAPVEIETRKGMEIVDTDEHPRPEITIEKLARLRTVFKKDGVVTAANASGICDGAGAIILASEEAVKEHNLKPLARLVSYGITGCDPKIMGIGPVSAIQQALQRANLSLGDMDRIEINEAFAAQFLACATELVGLDMDKANIHGGAISLGHPTGASGSRILAHLANDFHREGATAKLSIGSACIGGGQGIAVLLEKA